MKLSSLRSKLTAPLIVTKDVTGRRCENCKKKIKRKSSEDSSTFAKRKTCNRTCGYNHLLLAPGRGFLLRLSLTNPRSTVVATLVHASSLPPCGTKWERARSVPAYFTSLSTAS